MYAHPDHSTEVIDSFIATIQVNTDSSVSVEEVIAYDSSKDERHGIYRDIRTVSSKGEKMKISDINVVDEKGNSYIFTITKTSENVRIKIGDPATTFSGEKIYYISYRASNAVASLSDIDEIYWNVTGNEWNMPINKVIATIILPDGTISTKNACYFGVSGSTNICQHGAMVTDVKHVFQAPYILQAREGLTVAVGFPKGVVTPYQESFFEKYADIIGAIVLVLAVFSIMFTYWFRNWRDPKGAGIIVPQYDVPDGLTPMEVSAIVNEKIDTKSISAEIIYLATKGYLKIKQIEDVTLGIFKSTDYELIKLQETTSETPNFDRLLISSIFKSRPGISTFSDFKKALFSKSDISEVDNESTYLASIKLSSLKNKFYTKIPKITDDVADTLLNKQYYKNLGKLKVHNIYIVIIILGVIISGILSGIIQSGYVFTAGILGSLCFAVFWYLSPAKTEKGVATKEYILGLKEYLQIAEKDRLTFHNAPEKKPEVFEKLLPYAMVLGVEKAWAKEFEDIYVTPPSWYEGQHGSHFSAVALGSSLHDFNSFTSSALSSAPSRGGGSGGGGSSGGGGGGGGGGSW